MFGMACFADQGMSGASVPCWVTLRLIQTRAVKVVNVGPGAPDEHTGHPGHCLSLLAMLFFYSGLSCWKRSCRSAALVAYLGGRLRAAAEKQTDPMPEQGPNNTALAKPTFEKAEACGACASHRATIKP